MKKCLLCFSIIFLFLINDLVAQSTFQKIFYHTNPGFQLDEHINKLIIDSNQDFVFGGYTREVIQQSTLSSLFKTDTNGNLIWYKFYRYNNSLNDGILSLIETMDSNYLIAGVTADSTGQRYTSYIMRTDTAGNVIWSKIIPFSSATVYLNAISISGNDFFLAGMVGNYIQGSLQDVCIVKIDFGGNIIWSKYLTNNVSNEAFDIVTTRDSGCAFVGDRGNDIYYGKLDSSGNRQWTKSIAMPGSNYGLNIEQTNDGGYIIFSLTNGLGFGGYDILLVSTDSMGNILWSKVFGTIKSDTPITMNKLLDGSLIFTGDVLDSNLVSALSIRIDSLGNLMSSNIYGLNGGTKFSASGVHDDYFVFAGDYNYLPPNGLLLPYIVKTNTAGISGCFENPYVLFDSVIALTAINVSDTVVDGGLLLVDVLMNVYDETINIADSQFCFVNAINKLTHGNLIQIFPNPNNGNFMVQIDGTVNGKLIIYNAVGKIVHEQIINTNDLEFSLMNFNSGFYILKLIDNKSKKITTLKLIVQN